MLRSLDPNKGYSAPKSKKFKPTKSEEKKFSGDELESIDRAAESDLDLRVRRSITKKQRDVALAELSGAGA